MSDTFGASGLDNDLPGIGAAPGNARGAPAQLPSQLQSLVQHFFQQSTGPANPKFLPPAPGPGGGQQPPKPRLGSTDGPPDMAARSFAPAPANAPHPPPGFTPFIRPIPRDHSLWGQPEAFPRLPQSFELMGMYSQLGGYFAQHGGFQSGPAAAGMAAYSAAYQDAYRKGQDWKMKMAKEQIGLHAAQLADLERARTIDYADVFSRHSVEGSDPHDDLWRTAVEHGDKDVIAMMENGDSAEKVRRFLADHEAHIRSLEAANKKSTETDAEAELFGLTPRAAGGADQPYDAYTNPGGTHGGAPAAGGAAPAAPTGEVAGPGAPSTDARKPGAEEDPLSPDKTTGEDADNIADPGKRNLHGAAIEILKGNEPQWIANKDVKAHAGIEAGNLRNKLGQIINDAQAGKLKPEQILPEVRKQVGGQVANDLQGILNYDEPGVGGGGQGGGTGGKEGAYKELLGHIAKQIEPGNPAEGRAGWTASNYQARENFRTNVSTQTVIIRSNSLAADGNAVLADLNELQRLGRPATGLDLNQLVEWAKRDPMYAKLAGDWYAYNGAFNTIVNSGRHTETGEARAESVAPVSYASPAAFRAAMKGHMNDALGFLEGEHRRWETIGGKPWDMPSYNPKTEKELRDIRDMDYLTGTLPGMPHTNKKGVTKIWKGGNLNPFDTSNWQDQ